MRKQKETADLAFPPRLDDSRRLTLEGRSFACAELGVPHLSAEAYSVAELTQIVWRQVQAFRSTLGMAKFEAPKAHQTDAIAVALQVCHPSAILHALNLIYAEALASGRFARNAFFRITSLFHPKTLLCTLRRWVARQGEAPEPPAHRSAPPPLPARPRTLEALRALVGCVVSAPSPSRPAIRREASLAPPPPAPRSPTHASGRHALEGVSGHHRPSPSGQGPPVAARSGQWPPWIDEPVAAKGRQGPPVAATAPEVRLAIESVDDPELRAAVAAAWAGMMRRSEFDLVVSGCFD